MSFSNPNEAVDGLTRAVELAPNDPEANLRLVNLLRKLGKLSEAAKAGLRFLEMNPDHARMHLLVGVCHAQMLEFDAAGYHFGRAVEIEPRNPSHLIHHAKAQRILGLRQEALEELEVARKADPRAPGLLLTLGETLVELGRFEDAIAVFDEAIESQPRAAASYLARATARRVSEADAVFVDRIRHLLNEKGLDPRERSTLHYALAKSLDDLGDQEQALAHTDEAVRLLAVGPLGAPAWIDHGFRAFDQRFFEELKGAGNETDKPVFIVGAPRSGTTLLDQILTSHPQIGGAGELLFWLQRADQVVDAIKGHESVEETCLAYLALLERHSPGKARVTDKMPTNYTQLGPIHVLFPKARIIHCQRHPIDTCLSLYLNGHSISPKPFGETREQIVAGYKGYLEAMEHWRQVLPSETFLELRYEDLVRDRESITRQLLEFLGLPWDPACLQHEANTRDVATPSRWQVRQPIYQGSVGRWRRYEPWLGAFAQLSS